jgi:hypothetical protein
MWTGFIWLRIETSGGIKSNRMRWVMCVACVGEMRNAYKTSVGKPERNRPLGRSKRRWENYIKMDLKEIECDGVNCIHLTQDRDQSQYLMKTVVKFRVP